ncbi:IS3 family transposase [Streptomyces sp. NPDC006012]|uniref:IS3 family transposase n=1 Tax=Streptomyces sp. NPDC006012 TaxID=3364739 RepID=UPI00369FBB27
MRAVHREPDGTYGVPRITAELRDDGERINHKRPWQPRRGGPAHRPRGPVHQPGLRRRLPPGRRPPVHERERFSYSWRARAI